MNNSTPLEKMARLDNLRVAALFGVVLVVILVVYLFVAERSPGWLGLFSYIGRFAIVAVEASLYFGFGLVLLDDVITWLRTNSLLGFPKLTTLRESRRMAKSMKAHKAVFGVHTFLILAVFLSLGFSLSHRFTVFGFAFVGMLSVHFVVDTLRPAAVLYLANSSPDKIALQARIKRANFYYRVVALLDVEGTMVPGKSTDEWIDTTLGNDCMRTDAADERVWKSVVETLLRQVPLVVLDARDASPAVVFEVRCLLLWECTYKTLFVVGPHGEAPVLDLISRELPKRVVVATALEDIAPTLVSMFLKSSKFLPTPSLPTTEFVGRLTGANADTALKLRELGGEAEMPAPVVEAGTQKAPSEPCGGRGSVRAEQTAVAAPGNPPNASDSSRLTRGEKLGRKCSRCFRQRIEGEWICRHCGQALWLNIGTCLAAGLGFLAIAAFVIDWWLWRCLWFLPGVLLAYVGGSEAWTALRVLLVARKPKRPVGGLQIPDDMFVSYDVFACPNMCANTMYSGKPRGASPIPPGTKVPIPCMVCGSYWEVIAPPATIAGNTETQRVLKPNCREPSDGSNRSFLRGVREK